MIDKPLTFLFDFEFTDDRTRPYVMREFAAQGCTNLVLSDTLISRIIHTPRFETLLRTDIENTGITFVDSHAPFGPHEDLDVIDEYERQLMLDRLRIALRIAARFGVKTMTIHTGNGHAAIPGYTLQQYQDAIVRSLEALMPLAEELDMTICIENIWCPTNTVDQLLTILRRVNSPHLGICYDAGHANLMKCDRGLESSAPIGVYKNYGPIPYNDKILEQLLPHVVNCHLHDNYGKDDEHQIPGKGNIDWPHIMGLLKQAPRLACIQSEVIPVRAQAPISALCAKFKELMAMA